MRHRRITFEPARISTPEPNRTDIACFVGFVERRGSNAGPNPVPEPLHRWLDERGLAPDLEKEKSPERKEELLSLYRRLENLPVPVESWSAFDELFAWDRRDFDDRPEMSEYGATWLGAAVRSFFAEGGRKAYIVSMGTPPSYTSHRSERDNHLELLVPGHGNGMRAVPWDRKTWKGLAWLFGLEDVSFLVLPDLPELCSSFDPTPSEREPAESPAEGFVECSEWLPTVDSSTDRLGLPTPRCLVGDYERWSSVVALVREILRRQVPTVHLLAALPLAADNDEIARLPAALSRIPIGEDTLRDHLQLAFPWIADDGRAPTPGNLIPPDGAFAGILAHNALARGTYRSAGGSPASSISRLVPELAGSELARPLADGRAFAEVVSVFGRTPRGFELCSDSTPSPDRAWRFGSISRLVSALLSICRRLGEPFIFETSGEDLWRRVRVAVEAVLLLLWRQDALRGDTASQAFDVRCDRTTMTQDDIDAGRLLVNIRIRPAAPIEAISVRLDLFNGGVQGISDAEMVA